MLIPSMSVSQGIEIRHGCQFVSILVRALSKLPANMGRFLPCGVGPTCPGYVIWDGISVPFKTLGILSPSMPHCGLWEVLGYPKASASELLDGTLKLRH